MNVDDQYLGEITLAIKYTMKLRKARQIKRFCFLIMWIFVWESPIQKMKVYMWNKKLKCVDEMIATISQMHSTPQSLI